MYKKFIPVSLVLSFLLVGISLNAQWGGKKVKGEGPVVEKELNLSALKGVHLQLSADVEITYGSSQKVVIKAPQNIIDLVSTDVSNGVWKIKTNRSVNIYKVETFKIYITMTDLKELGVSGSGNLVSTNTFPNLDDLNVYVSGSGDLELSAEARNIKTKVSGSGDVELSGSCQEQDVKVSGSGDVKAYDLKTQICNVRVSGSGTCKVNASESLNAKVSGSGDIYYKGNPEKVKTKVSGSGDIESRS